MSQAEIINSMILFFIAVGIFILILGIFFIKEKQSSNTNLMINEQIEIEKQLSLKIEEADKILRELNEFSSYLKTDMEKKYKELLFLYQLIEEKEKSISNPTPVEHKQSVGDVEKIEKDIPQDIKEDIEASMILNNKNYDNIIKLYKNGVSSSDIAKKLNIGKGEVELVLSLTKMR